MKYTIQALKYILKNFLRQRPLRIRHRCGQAAAVPKFCRCHAHLCPEDPVKVAAVLEAGQRRHTGNAVVGIKQLICRKFCAVDIQKLLEMHGKVSVKLP